MVGLAQGIRRVIPAHVVVVEELANEEVNAGYFQKVWNANVASGVYYYRLEAVSVSDPTKRFVDVKKLLFLK